MEISIVTISSYLGNHFSPRIYTDTVHVISAGCIVAVIALSPNLYLHRFFDIPIRPGSPIHSISYRTCYDSLLTFLVNPVLNNLMHFKIRLLAIVNVLVHLAHHFLNYKVSANLETFCCCYDGVVTSLI